MPGSTSQDPACFFFKAERASPLFSSLEISKSESTVPSWLSAVLDRLGDDRSRAKDLHDVPSLRRCRGPRTFAPVGLESIRLVVVRVLGSRAIPAVQVRILLVSSSKPKG